MPWQWDWRSSLTREAPSKGSMLPRPVTPKSDAVPNLSYDWIEDRDLKATQNKK